MLGDFTLTLPTRVHFGSHALDALPEELARYGFGPYEQREAVLLFNSNVELTEENTVEYMI